MFPKSVPILELASEPLPSNTRLERGEKAGQSKNTEAKSKNENEKIFEKFHPLGETLTITADMTGEHLKKKILEAGFSLQQVATLLGYEHRQKFYSILKYDNVKSGIIEDVAKVTGKSIAWYYEEKPPRKGKYMSVPEKDAPVEWQAFVDASLIRLISETNELKKELEKMMKEQ